MPERLSLLKTWLERQLGTVPADIRPASDDASFRRYFRFSHEGSSYIVMDAPPDRESCETFVRIDRLLAGFGLHVPGILAEDHEQGFLLLSDLGERQYLDALTDESVDRLYGDAMEALIRLQVSHAVECSLPPYDRQLLLNEMNLFREWYLGRHLGRELSEDEGRALDAVYELLIDNALQQPQVCVHRDYHSRNLMLIERHNPGILDFQDAVLGPVTYDLVSLLRDCYVSWPRERVEAWALGYHDLATRSGIIRDVPEQQFLRWFDLMGVQRHLKASGIFARLNYRDGKPGYLGDIPRTLGYIVDVAGSYPELDALAVLLEGIGVQA